MYDQTNTRIPSGHQLSSFRLGNLPLAQTRAALRIAKLMRCGADGEVEDAARAFCLLTDTPTLDLAWDELDADDEEDRDRQVEAYMHALAQFRLALGEVPDHVYAWKTGGSHGRP